jgi:hypothetical protein
MAWTPGLHSVSRPLIVRNLLAYIVANQTEALQWARTQLGFTGDVPNFAQVYNSSAGRIHAEFPDLMLIRRTTVFDTAADDYGLQVTHTLGFEMEIAHPDPDALTELVEVYTAALISMLYACPRATLTEGVETQGHPTVNVTDADGDQTRGGAGGFLQTPRVVATISLLEVRDA